MGKSSLELYNCFPGASERAGTEGNLQDFSYTP